MSKFKDMINAEWTSLETVTSRMKGRYPYYFYVSTKEEMGKGRTCWYEVTDEKDEKSFLRCMSKDLRYKASRERPN